MLTQTAIQLQPGDTFTTNEGDEWHTVHTKQIIDRESGEEIVLLTLTGNHRRFWLWGDEEVSVRI